LITGRTIDHCNSGGALTPFNYENIFDFFLVDASIAEHNSLGVAIQALRATLNEAQGSTDKEEDFKHLLLAVEAVTNIIDKKAKNHINDNYERICEYQDGSFHYAA
jgi:hypothetical protein